MSKADIHERDDTSEISVKAIFLKVRSGMRYFKSKWPTILLITAAGALLGLGYSLFKKITYIATSTFVLSDESKSNGMLSQYAGLASLAGVNIPGGNGMFEGDNMLELYKSRSMIERALLQPVNIEGKNQLLIDRYVAFNKLREKWKDKDQIENITFNGDPEKFNRKQDSLITDIVNLFNKKMLNVYKPDKKLGIVHVDFASHDELFAKQFSETLVHTVSDFYVRTNIQKAARNVEILQRQADSVKTMLNSSISGVASAADAAPNANPLLMSLKVPSQRKQVDVQTGSAIYTAIVQNLELAKMSLRQATPLIQVIDKPILPLENNKPDKGIAMLVGALAGFIIALVFLFFKKVFEILGQ